MSSIREEELAMATSLVAEEDDERVYEILEYHLIVKNAKGGEEVSSGIIGGFDGDDGTEFSSGIAEDEEGVLTQYDRGRSTEISTRGGTCKILT